MGEMIRNHTSATRYVQASKQSKQVVLKYWVLIHMNYPEPIKKLVNEIAQIMKKHKAHLVTVESCTGGGIGFFCTQVAGASQWYERGHITYQNKAKQDIGVPEQVLQRHGAVSSECARAMALASLKDFGPNYYALSVTGIAGPEGGSVEKPVGTVCFGWAESAAGSCKTDTMLFEGDREAIRMQSIVHALQGLKAFVRQHPAI